ncbi:hypothetical protein PC110_g19532 [Phytophthora cactorum]|uniref:Uncharacterized protein n=1 Tax=Phytophthora cactorum TaxID=29920 RepID=A0A329RHZ4_9STRA|nr:hypothetical protein PC110_g19532 [Phytophthora cactorum]
MAPIINGPDDRLNAECHMSALTPFLPFFGKGHSNVMFLPSAQSGRPTFLGALRGGAGADIVAHEAPANDQPSCETETEDSSSAKTTSGYTLGIDVHDAGALRRAGEFISADDEEMAEEMPSPATNRKLKALLGQLADTQSVAMKLQCKELNLLGACDLLNGLLEVMSSFGDYLAPNSEIVHSPDFESGVVNVLGAQAKRITRAERSSLQSFLRRAPPPVLVEAVGAVGSPTTLTVSDVAVTGGGGMVLGAAGSFMGVVVLMMRCSKGEQAGKGLKG